MITDRNQRWREGRASYRPAGETLTPARYEVAVLDGETAAKAFVVEHHYSGSFPAARVRFGLFERAELVGVAVFSEPCRSSVTAVVPGLPPKAGVELGRFVLLDRVPGNGETWFLARAFAELRRLESVEAVVSFSDPVPRRNAAGALVFPGHIGTIYQAHNAVYLGRGAPRTLRLLPDGTVLSARAMSKLRAGERGWRYVARLLERHGAGDPCPEDAHGRRAWMARWVPLLTRTFRHTGNHKYAWSLHGHAQRALRDAGHAYPKLQLAA